MIRAILPKRENDPSGDGYFGASRGSRVHNGQDYSCVPGSIIYSPAWGKVTKLGYTYGSGYGDADPTTGEGEPYRYVEITDREGLRHRVFYVDPVVALNESVGTNDIIGEAQDITLRYPGRGMIPHVHYEIMVKSGGYIDPTKPRV